MKKIFILLVAMALGASTAFAQSDDEIQRQQEALQKQQQKEQQDLLKQQQKEQEQLQRQQAREEARMQKEAEQARQDEIKKEQDRQKREQAKAESDARKEAKAAEKKAKRAEHYAQWGRKPGFTADPYAGGIIARRMYGQNSLHNAVGCNLGVDFQYHRPIARRWDFNIGLGYRYSMYCYSHLNGPATDFSGKEVVLNQNAILVPLKLAHISKDNEHGWYLGLTPGINFGTGTYNTEFKTFRFDVSFGTQNRWLIFAPGMEVYFNLLPTYRVGDFKIHEFGVRITL